MTMHGAFDVGMHNMRLTLCAVKGREPPRPEPRPELPKHEEPARVYTPPREMVWARRPLAATWLAALLAYMLLVASDHGSGPRTHGSTLAVLVVVSCPPLLLLLHVCGAHTQRLAALTGAHLLVTAGFLADASASSASWCRARPSSLSRLC